VQKPVDGSHEVFVYNAQSLQQLLSIVGVKLRRARPLADAILADLSAECAKAQDEKLQNVSLSARPDGTVAVHIGWCVLALICFVYSSAQLSITMPHDKERLALKLWPD
jgi:hypothetical protein